MVKIRLKRMGMKKKPFYRVVVADERAARDGRFIDEIGYYNPVSNPVELKIDVEKEPPFVKLSETHLAATGLLHPMASQVNKIEMPEILRTRIERMKKMGEANNG